MPILTVVLDGRITIPASEQLLAQDINVNVTLVFPVSQYENVTEAYPHGIERCREPERVASVASFLGSRVDTAVGRALEEVGTEEALRLREKVELRAPSLPTDDSDKSSMVLSLKDGRDRFGQAPRTKPILT